MCDGTPKSPPLWRNLMIGGAMGGTPNTFFDYVRVYAIAPKASLKVTIAPSAILAGKSTLLANGNRAA